MLNSLTSLYYFVFRNLCAKHPVSGSAIKKFIRWLDVDNDSAPTIEILAENSLQRLVSDNIIRSLRTFLAADSENEESESDEELGLQTENEGFSKYYHVHKHVLTVLSR